MKLKKSLCLLVIVSLITGCKFSGNFSEQEVNILDSTNVTRWANLTEGRPDIACEFDAIGKEHNKALNDVYQELIAFRDTQCRSVDGKLSDEDISLVFNRYFDPSNATARAISSASAESEVPASDEEDFKFSGIADDFIKKVKTLIESVSENSPRYEVEKVISDIEIIEKDAETQILSEEKEHFYTFTATARASLAYWYDNLTDWDALRDNSTGNQRYISIFRRIACCVSSDIAGAVHGCDEGKKLAEKLAPGNKKVATAAKIVCSIAVGGWSSAEGWRTGKHVVVKPHEWLLEKVKSVMN